MRGRAVSPECRGDIDALAHCRWGGHLSRGARAVSAFTRDLLVRFYSCISSQGVSWALRGLTRGETGGIWRQNLRRWIPRWKSHCQQLPLNVANPWSWCFLRRFCPPDSLAHSSRKSEYGDNLKTSAKVLKELKLTAASPSDQDPHPPIRARGGQGQRVWLSEDCTASSKLCSLQPRSSISCPKPSPRAWVGFSAASVLPRFWHL